MMLTIQSRRRDDVRGNVVQRWAYGLALAAGIVPTTQAATYVVNSLNDDPIGTTTCTGGADPCNLRDAIDLAHHGTGADTVSFQAGLSGTIQLHTEEIAIAVGLTLTGPGADKLTIDGQGARIFNVSLPSGVSPSANPVNISKLRFIGGSTPNNGGAIVIGDASVTLSDCKFENNHAGVGGLGSGGAVYAMPGAGVVANLTVQRCYFGTNASTYDAGALYGFGLAAVQLSDVQAEYNFSRHAGGAVYFQALTTGIARVRLSNNRCGVTVPSVVACNLGGGAMALQGSTASATFSLSDLRAEDNLSVAGAGGALYLSGFANATLDRLQLSTNTAGTFGGALVSPGTGLALRNSTLANNQSTSGNGGGLALNTGGTASLVNVTLANNSATIGGGLYVASATFANVSNSIIANNTAATASPDASGSFALNYSLLKDPSGATFSGPNNLAAGTDPALGALAMNGGGSLSMLPAPGSPVLNVGDPATSGGTDQRGLPRVFGGRVDMGAVERQNPEDIIFRNGFD